MEKLIQDLEVSFGERELFRRGGTIREFEQVCRLQGESVSAFIRRFRLLERKLKDNRVPPYPEQARVVKLLDGLHKSVSAVLLAAGNQYNMAKVLEALRIQYPAGMTITGIPRLRHDPRPARGRGHSTSSRSSASTASTRSAASSRISQVGGDGNSGTRMSMTVATNGTTPSARRLTRRRIKKNANAVNTEEYDPAYDETDLADIPEEEIDYGEGTENPTAEGTEDPSGSRMTSRSCSRRPLKP